MNRFAQSPAAELAGSLGLTLGIRPTELLGLTGEPWKLLLIDTYIISHILSEEKTKPLTHKIRDKQQRIFTRLGLRGGRFGAYP